MIARKRPQDVIAAVKQLGRPNVYAFLIGSGDLEASLRQSESAGEPVRITGFVNQSMIPYHIKMADVLVVASEQDPHPLVATEAAICGLPLVVSDRCGLYGPNDILREGENGFVYPCGNIPELVSRLARLLDDSDLRITMGRRAIELAERQSAEYSAGIIAGLLPGRRRTISRVVPSIKVHVASALCHPWIGKTISVLGRDRIRHRGCGIDTASKYISARTKAALFWGFYEVRRLGLCSDICGRILMLLSWEAVWA